MWSAGSGLGELVWVWFSGFSKGRGSASLYKDRGEDRRSQNKGVG